MKHKTATLEGPLLDAAVAKAEGHQGLTYSDRFQEWRSLTSDGELSPFVSWSTQWEHGGPIIERERIELCVDYPNEWSGRKDNENDFRKMTWQYSEYYGPTALVAAMRAYVASKFGDEVDLLR